jgi:isopentenyl diphosphate isomerase/L-lactate dehydrogenase-like FMN-dependent dehydrogenase
MTRREAIYHWAGFLAGSPVIRAQTEPAIEAMVNIFDFEPVCKAKIPKAAYEYVSGGGWDEWTMRRNRRAFEQFTFRPRFFRPVDKLDVSTTVLGHNLQMPILVAPTGTHGLIHPGGELETVRGANAAGAQMVVSTSSSVPLAKIAAESKTQLWFQLYTGPDEETTRERVQRAVDAGCTVIVLTVDAPYNAPRERDIRNNLQRSLPEHSPRRRRNTGGESERTPFNLPMRYQAKLDWRFLDELVAYAKRPVLVKGILTPEDAALCLEHGAAGIVVSNHGGRYLDGDPATIEVLGEIVGAVQGKAPVLIDGGFRRGTDVLKALALGARAVLVGRPPLWGLGAFGAQGVQKVLELLRNELAMAMALSGRPNIASIDRSLIRP